jgi:hypothetical protein
MLLKKNLVEAQCASWWAQKFTLFEIFEAFQEEEAEMNPIVFKMRDGIFQS